MWGKIIVSTTILLTMALAACGETESTILPELQTNPPISTRDSTELPDLAPKLGDSLTRARDGMSMFYVPGGTFLMGSSQSQITEALQYCDPYVSSKRCPKDLFDNEIPQHPENVDGFWIDQTEVSYAQYQSCLEVGVCSEPQCAVVESFNQAELPVTCITWEDAWNYCQWVGARLPTEAEWEYAARGPDGNIFPWGNEFDGTRLNYCDIQCLAKWRDNEYDDGYRFLAPVGSFPEGASWCSAEDMAGNALEWVADWSTGSYRTGSQVDPPQGSDAARGIRGGAANHILSYTRGAWRSSAVPSFRYNFLGFRCAMNNVVDD